MPAASPEASAATMLTELVRWTDALAPLRAESRAAA